MKIFFKTLSILFSLTLIIAAGIIAYLALPQFGNQALIVRSGSMMPAIDVGAVVVVRPSETNIYNVGDIIAFKSERNSNTIITHRVTEVLKSGNSYSYKTKGDANEEADNWVVQGQNILGKSFLTAPFVGKVLEFAKSREGFPIMIVTPAAFVILLEIINIFREIRKKIKEGREKKKLERAASYFTSFGFERLTDTRPSLAGMKILIPLLFFGLTIPTTFAFFSDTETSTNNVFQAAAEFPTPTPSFTNCPTTTGASVVINEINWVGSNGDGLDEWVELCNTTNSPIDLTDWVIENLGTGNGQNAHVVITSGIIPANGFFLISNRSQAASKINVPPDIVDTNVSLSNGGEQLILKNSGGTVVDTANGTGAWYAGSNATPKKTMERIAPVQDGTLSTSWMTATTHTGMDASGPTDEFGTPKNPNGL